jgi:DNA primase
VIDVVEVNRQADLLQLATAAGVELKRKASTGGGEWAGACPFCGGRDRFIVQPYHDDGGRWYCRGCGGDRWHDAIEFVKRRDHVGFVEAAKSLGGENAPGADTAVLQSDLQSAPPELASPPGAAWEAAAMLAILDCADYLYSKQGAAVLRYLKQQRGLKKKTIFDAALGYNPRGRHFGGYWLEEGITIPTLAGPDIWAVNVRTSKAAQERGRPKYQAMTGSVKRGLYQVNRLDGARVGVVCEGEFDALLLAQFLPVGCAAVATGGATMPAERWRLHFAHLDRLLLVFDNDAAGQKAAAHWLEMFPWADVLQVPRGNDVTDYWRGGGDLAAWLTQNLEVPKK